MQQSLLAEDQVIGIVIKHETGVPVADLCRKHGVRIASGCRSKARGVVAQL